MKHAKKLASLLLALVMVFALAATAFAAQEGTLEGGTITITNAVVDQKYSVYQILYLESYNATASAYAYKANSEWEDFVNGDDIKGNYLDVDDQGYVTAKNLTSANAAAFAKLAQAYAKEHNITSDPETVTANSAEVKFENLKLGYYLVDSTLGTLCSLDTTNPDVTIKEKNTIPTNKKGVNEDSTEESYGNMNDADIGQTVEFKSYIMLPVGSENVVYHDKMSSGLTLDPESITVYHTDTSGTKLPSSYYEIITDSTQITDGCTFEVKFTQEYLNSLTANTQVRVYYEATLNEGAVVGGAGNPNESHLSYGDESNIKTTPASTTTTYTWSFDLLKYGNSDKNNRLAGAQFVLLNSSKTKVATIVDGKLTAWVDVPTADATTGEISWPDNTILTTNATTNITISGLDGDTYYLREIVAPSGYNKLADDQQVAISPVKSDDEKSMTLTDVIAEIENQSGTELPSTGGMGTTIFYVVGSVLVIGAAVLLITKKRMNGAQQ